MSMGTFKAAMDVFVSYKFGELLSSTSVVNAAQLCTAGTRVNSFTFTRGYMFVFRYTTRQHCYAGRAIRWALPRISSCNAYFVVLY